MYPLADFLKGSMAEYEGGGNADEKWRREIFHLSVGVSFSMSYVNTVDTRAPPQKV